MARVTRGAFHLPNTFHRVKNAFYLTFFHALVTKIQGGDTDIAVNSLELVIPCKNL